MLIVLLLAVCAIAWLFANLDHAGPGGIVARGRYVLAHRSERGEYRYRSDWNKTTRRDELRDEVNRHTKAVRDLAEPAGAAGRDFTPSERADVDRHMKAAKAAKTTLAQLEGDEEMVAMINGMHRAGAVNLTGGRPGGPWGKAMSTMLERTGQKALTPSGGITVPSLSTGIATIEDRPRSILQLIPFVPLDATDTFAFLRETVRDHQATTVAKGKRKPTSTYSVEKVEDRARTIAHLSEPIDRADLMDVALLQQYLDTALRSGVELELEDQIINGDGSTTGALDNLVGILATDGVQERPWDSSRVVTARKTVTVIEDLHLDPAGFAWLMSPKEWEAFELTVSEPGVHFVMGDAGQSGAAALPIDRAKRTLWGYPVITSTVMDDGAGILGDWAGSIVIREREQVQVTWSENIYDPNALGEGLGASDFELNKIRFRAEGRWGLAVMRPAAFIVAELEPGGSGPVLD